MKRERKKYEVLPGVPTPDIKTILDAASDFAKTGVEGVTVHSDRAAMMGHAPLMMQPASGPDVDELNALGMQVSIAETEAQKESKRKMQAIMDRAVSAPETMDNLRETAAERMTDEEKEELARKVEEENRAKAEEEAKKKAREDRRKEQQKALEESLARKAQKKNEESERSGKEYSDTVNEKSEAKKEDSRTKAEADGPQLASDQETMDDFSEFL
ncbi:MAG: hypothetical protein K6F49_12045 [Saccharofermentans sp.]|nr:hypothetical protein [Saccharofermentans sp.]